MPTGYREFIDESAGKNKHITHLEDVVVDDGASGAHFALGTLKAFGRMLDGGTVSRQLNVSVKWDGAPAIVFGPDPEDGRFFVATKHGAFGKSPRLAKTHAEVNAFYSSGPTQPLHVALDELALLHSPVVLQGDLLFAPGRTKLQDIGGDSYVTFQPNTILYAVNVESKLGQQVQSATLGIVIHTFYQGTTKNLADYRAAGMSPSIFSQLKLTKRVLALDAAYDDVSGTATFTDEESADFTLSLARVEASAAAVPRSVYDMVREEPLHTFVTEFMNAQVRVGKTQMTVDDLLLFIAADKTKELAARKTPKGQDSAHRVYEAVLTAVREAKAKLTNLFDLHAAIISAKNVVIAKLAQASRIGTFVPAGDSLRVTGPEGFVAVAHSGKAVKLVDRLEFSRINLTTVKSWR